MIDVMHEENERLKESLADLRQVIIPGTPKSNGANERIPATLRSL